MRERERQRKKKGEHFSWDPVVDSGGSGGLLGGDVVLVGRYMANQRHVGRRETGIGEPVIPYRQKE